MENDNTTDEVIPLIEALEKASCTAVEEVVASDLPLLLRMKLFLAL